MIKEILRLMKYQQLTLSELAEKICISLSELENRLELMEHMGYIEKVCFMSNAASKTCEQCSFAVGCNLSRNSDIRCTGYQLTKKGLYVIKK